MVICLLYLVLCKLAANGVTSLHQERTADTEQINRHGFGCHDNDVLYKLSSNKHSEIRNFSVKTAAMDFVSHLRRERKLRDANAM